MHSLIENFTREKMDDRLVWLNPPPKCSAGGGRLAVEPAPNTDFWQRTHYGFAADTGHFLGAHICGDFVLRTLVRLYPVNEYDQAGLMVRLSDRCWLKTSLEFGCQDDSKLGAVVTNHGYSDWSFQEASPGVKRISFQVRRTSGDYLVEYALCSTGAALSFSPIRLCHLAEDVPGVDITCGLYACSPKGQGFRAEFKFLQIESA